jgi:hypothetical protein
MTVLNNSFCATPIYQTAKATAHERLLFRSNRPYGQPKVVVLSAKRQRSETRQDGQSGLRALQT